MSKITDEFSSEVEKNITEIESTIRLLGKGISNLNQKLSEEGSDALKFRHFTAASMASAEVFTTYGELAAAVVNWHKLFEKFDSRDPQAKIGGGGK